ncbi:MAG: hypothetical protein AAF721_13335 [Myxococcota bacterium]
MHRCLAWVAVCLTWIVGPTIARAGKLGAMRSETQESGSSDSSGSSGSSDSSGSSSEVASSFGAALGEAMVEAYVETVRRLYTRYPYADGEIGFVRIVDPEAEDPIGQRFAGTFTVDGGYLSPTLGRLGVGTELMVRRFGLAVDLSPHLETAPLDALWLGNASLLVAVVLLPRWQAYAGIGVNAMVDGRVVPPAERVDTAGVNGTFRTTVLPVEPLVLRGRVDVGRLGAAPTLLGRATAGAMLGRVELFGGYELRRVGKVSVHGPTAGMRVWF